MILAAGRGERLRPITDEIPKALVDVGGQSLLERHLDKVAASGIDTAVINLGWKGVQIVERIGDGSRFGLTVLYSQEGDNVLETGGGIHRALPLLGTEPFVVVNADVFTDMPLPKSISDDADGHLVLVPRPSHKTSGDFSLESGRVRMSDAPEYTFSGIAIYRPEFFEACDAGRFPLAPMLFDAASRDRLSGEVYEGVWEDVGTPERLEAVRTQVTR